MKTEDSSSYNSALELIQNFRRTKRWPTPPRPTKCPGEHLQERISIRHKALHKLLAKAMTEPWPSMWDE